MKVLSVETVANVVRGVRIEKDQRELTLAADHVWSTIPITALAQLVRPEPSAALLAAGKQIQFRGMILIYLVVEGARFSEYDAHYFPEPTIPISRLSEPKNYSDGYGPRNLTVLCAELPCAVDGPVWTQGDDELANLVRESLNKAEIPLRMPVKQVVIRRLRQAYPIYRQGYEVHFDALDQLLAGFQGLLTFGRQGLFAHDNTHHALYMAYCAVKCLDESGRFDAHQWQQYRSSFESHVVED